MVSSPVAFKATAANVAQAGEQPATGGGGRRQVAQPPPAGVAARNVLALQGSVGNQAVQRLLAGRPTKTIEDAAHPAQVQRAFKRWKPKAGAALPAPYTTIDAKAKEIDTAVDAAHAAILNMIKTGVPAKLAGVSDKRYATWLGALMSGQGQATVTGYIIEDHATVGFRGDPMVSLQNTDIEGTRPDAVIRDAATGRRGYLDITSARDAGHVFDKKGNWGAKTYVVESLYPSINFGDPASSPLALNAADMDLVEQWREERAERKFVHVERAFRRQKVAYEIGQDKVVREFERLNSKQLKQIGGASSKYEDLTGVSRYITKYRDLVKKFGIVVSTKDGSFARLTFEQKLKRDGIAYTWEHVKQMYGL